MHSPVVLLLTIKIACFITFLHEDYLKQPLYKKKGYGKFWLRS